MAALDVALEQHVLDQLDKIFPGPDARAPEAYAWQRTTDLKDCQSWTSLGIFDNRRGAPRRMSPLILARLLGVGCRGA
jgi:hypothetical protein